MVEFVIQSPQEKLKYYNIECFWVLYLLLLKIPWWQFLIHQEYTIGDYVLGNILTSAFNLKDSIIKIKVF